MVDGLAFQPFCLKGKKRLSCIYKQHISEGTKLDGLIWLSINKLKNTALSFANFPAIYIRRKPGSFENMLNP